MLWCVLGVYSGTGSVNNLPATFSSIIRYCGHLYHPCADDWQLDDCTATVTGAEVSGRLSASLEFPASELSRLTETLEASIKYSKPHNLKKNTLTDSVCFLFSLFLSFSAHVHMQTDAHLFEFSS